MLSQQIRRQFLAYFKKQGHAVIPSSPVIPHDDPTLLFINAGMNQFKDVFLGSSHREYTKATTSQKCVRVGGKHNDLDNVGHTSRHLTFFEMLGNFSFGDYFKERAITYAWEVSTEVFGLDPERIWVTIFETDDEAYSHWKKIVPEKRIVRLGEKDNFWAMGDTGPCGPCSELLFDRGERYGNIPSPKEDLLGERYLEFWNLVFMQFNRDASGKMSPLPKQSIDTGAGLERVVSLKMGVDSVFATDIFQELIAVVEGLCQKKYDPSHPTAPAFHVIADHIRSLSFAIADGAQPSNVERGYILRKLLRRAVRYGRTLGIQEPFLADVLPRLVTIMGPDYPELVQSQGRIAEILHREEEGFLRTLKRGGNILNSVIDKALANPLQQITGEEAFKLKDTYGLPLEEILLIAKDSALSVNLEAYELLEEAARVKSRSAKTEHAQNFEETLFKRHHEEKGPSSFVGYTQSQVTAQVTGLLAGETFLESLPEGQEGIILLNTTVFYAEKGGQVGDQGIISHKGGTFTVTDCRSPYPGVIAHMGTMTKGKICVGDTVEVNIDTARRQKIANCHTATHLLHLALQKVVGEHIRQAGSLVEPSRLRFDFNHHKALSLQELRHIEQMVNAAIRENTEILTSELSYEEVQTRPDIKQFFGEKYGAVVRMVSAGASKELCGGTHTSRLGTIGLFKIVKEGSISSGVRRIEAVTAGEAERLVYEEEDLLLHLEEALKSQRPQLLEKLVALQEENKTLSTELKKQFLAKLKTLAQELSSQISLLEGIPLLTAFPAIDPSHLTELADLLMARNPSLLLVLAAQSERCQLLVRVSSDLIQKRGIKAVDLIRHIAPLLEGSGGGKAESAQAGGKNPKGIPQAFAEARKWIQQIRQE